MPSKHRPLGFVPTVMGGSSNLPFNNVKANNGTLSILPFDTFLKVLVSKDNE